MVLSFVFLTNAPIATFGPIIARKFISTGMGWRWCYYINIICVGLAMVLLFFFYHPPTFGLLHDRKTKRELMKKLDCEFLLDVVLEVIGVAIILERP
jgi:MFS family permease